MEPFAVARGSISSPSPEAATAAQAAIDGKTKPPGSLGRLETLAVWYAGIRGDPRPPAPIKAVVVMAGDHGVASRGVSAYPQVVTAQMLQNFAAGGAAINVLARRAGARLTVVDMGVATPWHDPAGAVRRCAVARGTADFTAGPAMSIAECRRALDRGAELAAELDAEGVTAVALGEMGIANSTSAAALTAALLGAPAVAVVGRGTGVDDAGYARKLAAVEAGLARHAEVREPLDLAACLGGFEIVGLAGLVVGAASRRMAIVVDGFIAGAAALLAARLEPAVLPFMVAAHRSVEPGHRWVLDALELQPYFDLGLRLGEGSGAALLFHLLDDALAILADMATFTAAGVSDRAPAGG